MIKGAKIESIHAVSKHEEGMFYFSGYFTCDRGFTFCLPTGGYPWETSVVPPDATELRDRKAFLGSLVSWFRPREQCDRTIELVTRSPIAEVRCDHQFSDLDFYDPEGTTLQFEDGGRLYVRYVTPEGIGAGLVYLPKGVGSVSRTIDYFSTLE